MTVLLTGFEPFHTHKENPSQDVAKAFAGNDGVVTQVLPVDYARAGTLLIDLVKTHRPDAVIMLGLAESAALPRLERVALNIDDASIPDNEGASRRGSPICEGAPLALETPVDVHTLRGRLVDRGFATEISNHAGAYLCNHIYYEALHHCASALPDTRALFVHVPPYPAAAEEREIYAKSLNALTEEIMITLTALTCPQSLGHFQS